MSSCAHHLKLNHRRISPKTNQNIKEEDVSPALSEKFICVEVTNTFSPAQC